MQFAWQRLALGQLPRDPISLISLGVGLAGSAVSAMGMIQQGKAAERAANYNAAIAENNATLAKNKALAEETMVRNRTARQVGTAGAAIGASGITVEGTPLDVLAETVQLGELDALTTRWKGTVEASGFKDNAVLERMQGKAAMKNAQWGAAGTLLSGIGSAASGYARSTAGTSLRMSG